MNFSLIYYLKKYFINFFKIRYKIFNMWGIELKLKKKKIINLLFFLKKNQILNFFKLYDIIVIDLPSKKNRFKIYYILESFIFNTLLYVTVITNEVLPIFSISKLYKNSIWLEREIWDLYGISFIFNNDLRRILLDYGFQGHPLRKDFPLTGFLELSYNLNYKKIIFTKLELMQEYRFLNFYKK